MRSMSKTKFESFKECLLKGDLEGVRNNLEKDFLEEIIDDGSNKKWRPIHFACRYSSIEIVKLLINQNCNIESEDINECKPIHVACQYSSVEIVKLLLDENYNIESENKDKWKPIHFACLSSNIEILKFLIDQNCKIESENENQCKPIHVACQYGSVETVKLLIDQNCNIESEDKYKWRPIHFACLLGDIDKVKLLLTHRCNIKVSNGVGETPLEVAKSNGHKELFKWIEGYIKNSEISDSIRNNDFEAFLEHFTGSNPLIVDITSEKSWLDIAYSKRANKFIKFFIDQSINPLDITTMRNVVDNNIKQTLNYQLWEEVLLYKSIRDHNLKGFKWFCCPNVINRQRKIIPCSYLEVAAEHGSFVFVDEILKKSIFDSESWKRAKVIALEKGHNEIAESILIREFLLKCRQKAGLSILHTAVCDNEPDMVEHILKEENLVDANQNHESLGTALALAIELCNEKCLSVLTRFKVNFNTRNKYFQTPLHEAIANGMIDHCRYLIDSTKDIDEKGFMEQSALHYAVMNDCEELCDELMKKEADCLRYIEVLQFSTQIKDSLPLTKRENALTLCAKINKTIYPCFLESLDETNVNSCDDEGNSLIHLAASLLNKDLCKSLIELGGDVNSLNKRGNSPLFELLSQLDKESFYENEEKVIEIVNVFMDSECNINQRFSGNLTLFDIALQFNSERLLLTLISSLQPDQSLEINKDLLGIALEKNYFRLCETLLQLVPQGQFEKYINKQMINNALLNDQRSILKYLLDNSSLEIKESMTEKVLYHFARLGDEDSFQCLLDTAIMKTYYFRYGETLLTSLLKEGKLKFCEKLIQSEKNIKKYINLKNKKNQTPLQVSIEMELMEMVQHFSFETLELDNEDDRGRTALMQLFEKLSNNVDSTRSIRLMNAIRTLIHMGGNIYHKRQRHSNIIEYCSPPEARKEIESYFQKLKGNTNSANEKQSIFGTGKNLFNSKY